MKMEQSRKVLKAMDTAEVAVAVSMAFCVYGWNGDKKIKLEDE